MSAPSDKLIIIGRIGSAHGLKGWVKIHSFTELKSNIMQYQPWLVSINHDWRSLEVNEFTIQNKQLLARLPGIDNRDRASEFTHAEIGIYRHQLPDLTKGEYYWEDLIGLTVKNINQTTLGYVDQVVNYGASDILMVKNKANNKDHMIPYVVNQFIKQVDLEQHVIVVDWDPDF